MHLCEDLTALSDSALIFDCDGTLADTEHLKYEAWRTTLAQYGVPLTFEQHVSCIGLTCRAILRKLGLDHIEFTKFYEQNEADYRRIAAEKGVGALTGNMEFFHRAQTYRKEFGLRIGMATSDNALNTDKKLQSLGIRDCFDAVVSIDDVRGSRGYEEVAKPRPHIYQAALNRLGVEPQMAVAFEDTEAGVLAAAAAGCAVIALPQYQLDRDYSRAALCLPNLSGISVDAALRLRTAVFRRSQMEKLQAITQNMPYSR